MATILDARLITQPTVEPLDLDAVKLHLRVDHTDEDTRIDALMVAARSHVENEAWTALCSQSWRLYLSAWPVEPLLLPRQPIASITSIKYFTASGAEQTVNGAVYKLIPAAGEDAKLWLAAGQQWPSAALAVEEYPITVEYVAGYGDGFAVPEPIRQYMLLLIGAMYENREMTAQQAAQRLEWADGLLSNYRFRRV